MTLIPGSKTVSDSVDILRVAIYDSTDTEKATLSNPVRTDPVGTTTQPVSAATLPLPTGAATEATLVKLPVAQASTTSGQSGPLAQGAVTTAAPTYTTGQTNPLSLTTAGEVRASVSGVATAANQTTEITALQILDDVPTAQNGAFVKGNPIMGHLDDTSTTAATEDNVATVRITAQRAIHTNLRSSSGTEFGTITNPLFTYEAPSSSGEDLVFGSVTLSLLGQAAVRATTYTEQASNAQRSINSSSVLDTSAGTGARTVRVTYYTVTGTGPFTEDLTLNGITAVNTVSTTICFIENIMVLTAGSGGSNAGIITLHSAAAGVGTIGTIAIGDNQTLWAHHYVALNKTCYINALSCGNNATTVGSGGIFTLKEKPTTVANAVEIQVTDFTRVGGTNDAFVRPFSSAIPIVGPARITAYVSPEAASTVTQYASIDFVEL